MHAPRRMWFDPVSLIAMQAARSARKRFRWGAGFSGLTGQLPRRSAGQRARGGARPRVARRVCPRSPGARRSRPLQRATGRVSPMPRELMSLLSIFSVLLACGSVPQPRPLPPLPKKAPVTRGALDMVFPSVDAAAIEGCQHIREHAPHAANWEYAGCLYGKPDAVRVGLPETLQDPAFCMTPEPPLGELRLGDYHSHPTREDFSEVDKKTRWKTPQYLCAPSGAVYKRDPSSGVVTRISP
jgi:proteasome lid subunit RPN8/RPN11